MWFFAGQRIYRLTDKTLRSLTDRCALYNGCPGPEIYGSVAWIKTSWHFLFHLEKTNSPLSFFSENQFIVRLWHNSESRLLFRCFESSLFAKAKFKIDQRLQQRRKLRIRPEPKILYPIFEQSGLKCVFGLFFRFHIWSQLCHSQLLS